MFDVGLGEILVILLVALLIFGPDRLPRAVAKGLRSWRDFRATVMSARNQLISGSGLTAQELRESGLGDIAALNPANFLDDDSPEASKKSTGRGNRATAFDPEST
jgi:Sec-independent protein translocase protein TatA